MNYVRVLIAGVAGGIAIWLTSFVMHGVILGPTYLRYPVFTQEQASPLWFLVIEIFIAITAALLFAKTRRCWGAGVAGGATFGVYAGLFSFFPSFFNPLVLEGWPYYLAWCWGGINFINAVVLGVVLALVYKE